MSDTNVDQRVAKAVQDVAAKVEKFKDRGIGEQNTKASFIEPILDPDEAESRAWAGLLKAVENYRLGSGFKFSVYARTVIKNSIFRAFRELRRPIRRRERRGSSTALRNAADDGKLRNPTTFERFTGTNSGHRIDNIADAMERAGLNDQERTIIDARFRLDETRKEIGRRLGVSATVVKRIELAALAKIAGEIDRPDVA